MICFIGSILRVTALSHPLVARHVPSWPKHARARLGLVRVLGCAYVCVCVCVCLAVCNYACVRACVCASSCGRGQATPDPLGLDRTLRRLGGLIGPIFFFYPPPLSSLSPFRTTHVHTRTHSPLFHIHTLPHHFTCVSLNHYVVHSKLHGCLVPYPLDC